MLPSDWRTVRPIEPDEVRVVQQGAVLDRALVVNQRTEQVKSILPASALESQEAILAATQGINLLVLGLGQGSIGAAGYAFSDYIGVSPMLSGANSTWSSVTLHCQWSTRATV